MRGAIPLATLNMCDASELQVLELFKVMLNELNSDFDLCCNLLCRASRVLRSRQ